MFGQQYGAITPTDYSQAIQSDPFQEEPVNDEDDNAIEEALRNTRTNSNIVLPKAVPRRPSQDATVQDTLSRFASAPRRAASLRQTSSTAQDPTAKRQTFDVDSFKRLLLTGESGSSNTPSNAASYVAQLASDSSSNTDTASLSQPSILEGGHQTVEETPRSSYELDRGDLDAERNPRAVTGTAWERKPAPPPPTPRHGRPLTEATSIRAEHPTTIQPREYRSSSLEPPDPSPSHSADTTPRPEAEDTPGRSSVKKRPPPPPLARRKSQNKNETRPGMVHTGSSRHSPNSESGEPMSLPASTPASKMAPPPPPRRTPSHAGGRRPSADLPSPLEEYDPDGETASISSIKRTLSASKQTSQASFGMPPPLPPPRKARGSNRNSVDSQRPSLSTLELNDVPGRSSSDHAKPGSTGDSRNISRSATAADILADLAALQREVDDARRHA